MTDDPEMSLADLVVTRMAELDISGREAARRAGGSPSYETIRHIARGVHGGKITDPVAEGLARALQLPLKRIYDAAGVPQPGARWRFPDRFSRLDATQRSLIEDLASALLDAYEKGRRSVDRGQGETTGA